MKVLCFLCLITLFSVAEAKEITIEKLPAGNPISIDGDDYDWPATAVWQAVDQHKGEPANKNNTVSLKMTYDDKFLYVLVKVLDAMLDTSQSKNSWEKDCIDLYFVLNDTVSDGTNYFYKRYGTWQFRKVYGRDLLPFYNANRICTVSESDIAGGYLQEWKLSWDTLASPLYGGYFSGEKFRFECGNGDNDGAGRNSVLFWNSNADDQYSVINNQGYVNLETPIDGNNNTTILSLSQSTLSIADTSGLYTLNILTDSAWIAESDAPWLTLDKASDVGNSELKLTVAQNPSEARTAKVTVKVGNTSRILTVNQSKAKKTITIKKCTTAPVIDGDDSDWPASAVEHSLTESKYWNTTNNNTVTYRMTYNDSFVFVAVKVLDATFDTVQSVNFWEKDNVMLYFVLHDTIPDGTNYSTGTNGAWQFIKVYGRDVKYNLGYYTVNPGKVFIVEEQDIDGGYLQEWKLPWDVLASPLYGGQWGGKEFRFECENDDNDGAGRGMLFWNSNEDDQWNMIKSQGRVILETPVRANFSRYLITSKTTLEVENNFESYHIDVYSDSAWTAQTEQSWISLNHSSSWGNSYLGFSVSKNTSLSSRIGHITITSGNLTKVIEVTQAKANAYLTISKCTTAPVIDGNTDDQAWANAVGDTLAQAIGAANKASFKMTYDDQFLYVLVTVEDTTPNKIPHPSNMGENDCVELYFSMDTMNSNFYKVAGDYLLRKACGVSKENGGVESNFGRKMDFSKSIGFDVAQKDGTPYVQEWKIPIDSLTLGMDVAELPFDGTKFRFEIKVVDNNGTSIYKTGQTFWNTNKNNLNSTNSNFGYIKFAEPIDPVASLQIYSSYAYKDYLPGTGYFYINSNSAWTAQSDASWLTLNSNSGIGDAYLYFNVLENKGDQGRKANIIVTSGNITKKVEVYQDEIPCYIYLDTLNQRLNKVQDSINLLLAQITRTDTTFVTINKTIKVAKSDTVAYTQYDTVRVNKYNTVVVNKNDTIRVTQYDTIQVAVLKIDDYTAIVNLSGANTRFKLYPNPAKDKLEVECDATFSQVEIFSFDGKRVFSKLLEDNKTTLYLNGFKEGSYILKLHTDRGIINGKFVITKQ